MTEPRPVDALVAEIGSTTTVVSAFDGLSDYPAATPCLVGQGVAATSVADGDVTLGVNAARAQLEAATGPLAPRLMLATSSAAGGLRMTVHGLTQRMTAMAAREAALGAGGVVEYVTAGRLRDDDLRRIDEARAQPHPAGRRGGGRRLRHRAVQRRAPPRAPGAPHRRLRRQLRGEQRGPGARSKRAGFRVRLTSNVYPGIDELDIVPARAVIHDAFEEHITHAPGMERIGEVVNGRILPTPGAVLIAAERLAEEVGDLVVIDVGGATTDVHSVTDGSPEIAALMIEPQPHSKRTVEGDLGTFVSAAHVVEMLAEQERPVHLPPPLPTTPRRDRRGAHADALRRRHRACSATPVSWRTSTRPRAARPWPAAATSRPAVS